MESIDRFNKIKVILNGNLSFSTPNNTEIFGHIEYRLKLSNLKEVNFIIAKKNNLGIWENKESMISDLFGEFLEEGSKFDEKEALLEVEKKFLKLKNQLVLDGRSYVDEKINTSFFDLKRIQQRLSKANPETLQKSLYSRSKQGDLDNLYRNDLTFLLDNKCFLTESEINDLTNLHSFFNSIESNSFEEIRNTIKSIFGNTFFNAYLVEINEKNGINYLKENLNPEDFFVIVEKSLSKDFLLFLTENPDESLSNLINESKKINNLILISNEQGLEILSENYSEVEDRFIKKVNEINKTSYKKEDLFINDKVKEEIKAKIQSRWIKVYNKKREESLNRDFSYFEKNFLNNTFENVIKLF